MPGAWEERTSVVDVMARFQRDKAVASCTSEDVKLSHVTGYRSAPSPRKRPLSVYNSCECNIAIRTCRSKAEPHSMSRRPSTYLYLTYCCTERVSP